MGLKKMPRNMKILMVFLLIAPHAFGEIPGKNRFDYDWSAEEYLAAVEKLDEIYAKTSGNTPESFDAERLKAFHGLKLHYIAGSAPVEHFSPRNMDDLKAIAVSKSWSGEEIESLTKDRSYKYTWESNLVEMLFKRDRAQALPTLSPTAVKSIFFGISAQSLFDLQQTLFDKDWAKASNKVAVEVLTVALYSVNTSFDIFRKRKSRTNLVYGLSAMGMLIISISLVAQPKAVFFSYDFLSSFAITATIAIFALMKDESSREVINNKTDSQKDFRADLKVALRFAKEKGYPWKDGVSVSRAMQLIMCKF